MHDADALALLLVVLCLIAALLGGLGMWRFSTRDIVPE